MPLPEIRTCIVCEDARFEKRNVVSLMGCYGPPPDVSIYLVSLAAPAKLCFAFYGKPISGRFTFQAELRAPNGKLAAVPIPPQLDVTPEKEKGLFLVVFWFPNILFPKADEYTIRLLSNGEECYKSTFRITEATLEQRLMFA